ncbi:glycosyltransferase family 2 protein [Pedobacter gandavensis]|uniref:glycosyltransferase family 2 protein n=1 Tax=Pedobacter gandavensis TaxID=2679963 RepID=UPI0029308803|nr:glycosyltransferase family 2 protein [Pedobacter gandavensis]
MVTNKPSISLLIATYNWPEALNLCLASVLNQRLMPDEIIIADDGSRAETTDLIESFRSKFSIPLIHVWQEDNGFQLSKIRNKAIAKASKEYIVQVDGDLILEENFIADHARFAQTGTFVSGTRVQMSDALSKKLIAEQRTAVSVFSKGITNFSNGLRSYPASTFLASRYKAKQMTYVRGCNMAFWRKDLLNVNGYNEAIVGWGREDSELAIRLINSGIRKRILKFGAVVFHIYHPEAQRNQLSINDAILSDTITNQVKTCKTGLSQYL